MIDQTYSKEGRTAEIREGVSIKLAPEEAKRVKQFVSEGRYYAHFALHLSKLIAATEIEMWHYLGERYPALSRHNCSLDWQNWVVDVGEKHDPIVDVETILPPPFASNALADGLKEEIIGKLREAFDAFREEMDNEE